MKFKFVFFVSMLCLTVLGGVVSAQTVNFTQYKVIDSFSRYSTGMFFMYCHNGDTSMAFVLGNRIILIPKTTNANVDTSVIATHYWTTTQLNDSLAMYIKNVDSTLFATHNYVSNALIPYATKQYVKDTLTSYPTTTVLNSTVSNYVPLAQKAANNGVATLDNTGKIPYAQIPAIDVGGTVFTANSVSAMLALSQADTADFCVRTDSNCTFILTALPSSVYSNWVKILTPPAIQVLNGLSGANVTIGTGDISETGGNQYFTTARARAANSAGTGIGYSGGVITNTGVVAEADPIYAADTVSHKVITKTYGDSRYLQGNQTITLSGDVSGSGTTAITTTIGASKVTNSMLAGSIAASKLVGTDIVTVGNVTVGAWGANKIAEIYGGTNQNSYTLGDMLYSSATNTLAKLAGNITTTKKFLTQTGDGTNSAAPSWGTVSKSDVGLGNVENTALSTWGGSTNVTTLGTIGTGTWNGTAIGDSYISSASTWNAKQAALSGTGFVKISGTTISYDNSTYLTTALTSLNGLTGATQTFAVGTSGSDFAISSSGTAHTFNLPDASTANRGVVTTGTQTFAGAKTFTASANSDKPLSVLVKSGQSTKALTITGADGTTAKASIDTVGLVTSVGLTSTGLIQTTGGVAIQATGGFKTVNGSQSGIFSALSYTWRGSSFDYIGTGSAVPTMVWVTNVYAGTSFATDSAKLLPNSIMSSGQIGSTSQANYSGAHTMTNTDWSVAITASATMTLPAASTGNNGANTINRRYRVILNCTACVLTIAPNGTDKINGTNANVTYTQAAATRNIVEIDGSDGTQWFTQ